MFIVKYKNFFLAFTTLLVISSVALIGTHGIKLGIDFTGGSVLEGEYAGVRPDIEAVKGAVQGAGVENVIVQHAGDNGIIIKMPDLTQEQHAAVSGALADLTVSAAASSTSASSTVASFKETQFNAIGPAIGSELQQKAVYGIALVIFLIVLYIAFAFRHVSRPVKSWKYGLIAVITLLHDVAIPVGFITLYGSEIDALFVTAILAILGFSIHDTIVVFDRIRENLRVAGKKEEFAETVGKSLNQTFARSINTSLTVVLVLVVLYFMGGSSTHDFALTLIVGIVAGTYSSLFFASPLLVQLYKWQETK